MRWIMRWIISSACRQKRALNAPARVTETLDRNLWRDLFDCFRVLLGAAQDPRRQKLIAAVLADFERLSDETRAGEQ
jgi:hypothetical protein